MIKDGFLKLVLLPLFSLIIPLAAGIGNLHLPDTYLILSFFYFTGVLYITWQIILQLVSYLRRQPLLARSLNRKLLLLPVSSCITGIIIYFVSVKFWQLSIHQNDFAFESRSVFWGGGIAIFVSLIYEILFLNAEKELEGFVLRQIDNERIQAELNILKNELDPHFFFNCLTALTQLVYKDQDKAYQFIYKLSSVYKYFLINKEKELVSLKEELDFLDNYYFLLKVRFDNSIQIEYEIDQLSQDTRVLPCTLQVLVENAIKHNLFSEKEPLLVTVASTRHHLVVSNPIRPKLYSGRSSTRIGLKNLKLRYQHVLNREILIQTFHNKFLVKLPIVKTTES